jgi:hypothetical protein
VLEIRVLGGLEVIRDGAPATLVASRKTRALLAYLALTRCPHRREQLCEMFWDVPDDPRGALRGSLSKTLLADRQTVELRTETLDIDFFSTEVCAGAKTASIDELASAAASFRGPSIEELIPAQEQAIRLSPRDPQIGLFYSRIGSGHLLRSRTDEATIWYEKARNATPAHPEFRTFLASVYALKDESERAAVELAEARRLVGDDRYSSIERFRVVSFWGVPNVRAMAEMTFFAGLRKAGVPQE